MLVIRADQADRLADAQVHGNEQALVNPANASVDAILAPDADLGRGWTKQLSDQMIADRLARGSLRDWLANTIGRLYLPPPKSACLLSTGWEKAGALHSQISVAHRA